MSEKRKLPAWMVTSDDKSCKERTRNSLKRKLEINTNKHVQKKCTKRKLYWMNEGELIETALSVIKREKKQTAAGDGCPPMNTETTVIPETDHEEMTDSEMSEPDVDIANQETVPYSKCLEERQCSRASDSSDEQL